MYYARAYVYLCDNIFKLLLFYLLSRVQDWSLSSQACVSVLLCLLTLTEKTNKATQPSSVYFVQYLAPCISNYCRCKSIQFVQPSSNINFITGHWERVFWRSVNLGKKETTKATETKQNKQTYPYGLMSTEFVKWLDHIFPAVYPFNIVSKFQSLNLSVLFNWHSFKVFLKYWVNLQVKI